MRKMLRWENHKNNCFKNNNNCFRLSYSDGIEKIKVTICSQGFYITTEKIVKFLIRINTARMTLSAGNDLINLTVY